MGLIQRSITQTIHHDFGLKGLSSSSIPAAYYYWFFLHLYFSSSVATYLRCGGMFNNQFIANCPESVPVKNF